MLHLLPIRTLLGALAVVTGVIVLAAVYLGQIGVGNPGADVRWIVRYLPYAAVAIAFVPFLAWRWLSPVQKLVFPYLGGHWTGELRFDGAAGPETRQARLEIRHSLISLEMILESDESTSRTVVVHAKRDRGLNRDRLYYTYLNERKEGVAGAGDRYVGLAVLRTDGDASSELHGEYFTERRRIGKLHFTRTAERPLWRFWE